MSRFQQLADRVQALRAAGLQRELLPLRPTGPTTARLADGLEVVLFNSNDYLGLAQEPELVEAWAGAGSTGSRLLSGDRPEHHALEEDLSRLFGRPATLFGSGWHANLALLTTLLGKEDEVASDALNHASIIDGIRLSGARRQIVPHGAFPSSVRLAVVEGLFSMDGDRPDLARWAGEHWLMVDEAHAVGCIGPDGRGVAAAQGVEIDFLVGTLGKSYGTLGAFVVGPPELRELLVSAGRTMLFSTGLPAGAAAASRVGLRLATEERRERLRARGRQLRAGLASLGIAATGEDHIVPIVLGPRTMEVSARLRERGLLVPGIRPPTVAPGTERLRVSLSAAHSEEQIARLIEGLGAGLGGP